MNKNNFRILIGVLLFASFVLIALHTKLDLILIEQNERYDLVNDSCNMNFKDYNITRGVNGLYVPGDYYCVWVKGRSAEDVNSTVIHELTHHNIFLDRKHFCKGG